jgi:simple sugar transport system permease protein
MPETLLQKLSARFGGRIEPLLVAVIIALCIVLAGLTPYFLTVSNWVDLIETYSVTAIFAMGLLVVLVAGGIDISFTAVASVAQYATAVVATRYGVPGIIALPLCLLIGIVLGCVNGALIYYLRVTSIIITIATLNLYFALLMYFSEGKLISTLPDWWSARIVFAQWEMANGDLVRITMPIVVMVVTTVLTWMLLNGSTAGRQLYAMGGNPEAARRVGVNLGAMHFLAYGYLGLLAGLAGLVQAHRVGESIPNALFGGELNVLAAAVLGGASLTGGAGTVPGVLLGILLLAILQNGLNLMGVSPYFFQIVIGIVILVATTITMLKFTRGRRATEHA